MNAKPETQGKKKKKERADTLVLSRDLSESREKAQALIMAGLVFSGGKRVEKPGEMVDPEAALSVVKPMPYVGRGGLKLEEALDAFAIDCRGMVAADLGSSTGGFTDCLLQRGARIVYAVDVSISQLDWRLRRDERVIPLEMNARYLCREDFPESPMIVTMDVSFISVLKVLPAIRSFLGNGILLSLLKPQFEAGKGQVGKRGILRDPARHEAVLNRVLEEAREMGFVVRGLLKSSVRGQKGNREFFVCWALGRDAGPAERIRGLVREVVYGE